MQKTFSHRLIGVVLMLTVMMLACSSGNPKKPLIDPAGGVLTQTEATATYGSEIEGPTIFGIEYGVPGLAEIYAEAGADYVKLQPVFGIWGLIEPEQGFFNWSATDAVVAMYQAAGFSGIQLLITAESPWASMRPPALGDKGNSFPKTDYLDDYARFVQAFVERYDGDGYHDMPGLIYPIHHYGIEREFTGFWPSGDAGDYVRLLEIAHSAIKAADPQAKVFLVALLLVDVFNGNPSPEEVSARFNQGNLLGYDLESMKTVLGACDFYDVVDFHNLGDYTEIQPTADWIRQTLEDLGCPEKPIWIGDAFSMSALTGYNDPFGWLPPKPFYPADSENIEEVIALLESAANPQSEDHEAAVAWLQAEMARGLVKKAVVSAAEGLAGINFGNLEDWAFGDNSAVNTGLVRSMGASIFMGMVESQMTSQHAGEPLGPLEPATRIRQPGSPRPAYYALEMVLSYLSGYAAVEDCQLEVEDIFCFHFQKGSRRIIVLWFEDEALYLPGMVSPELDIILSVDSSVVTVLETPTISQPASVREISVQGTGLALTVNRTPKWVIVSEPD